MRLLLLGLLIQGAVLASSDAYQIAAAVLAAPKEMRSGAVLAPLFELVVEALREAAKRGSFRGLGLTTRVPVHP